MSFRVEEKLYIKDENLFNFKKFLNTKSAKSLYKPRIIESLYFDNNSFQIHNDSVEGLTPRKKIRVRNYPNNEDKKIYFEIKYSSVEGRYKTRKIIDQNEFLKKRSEGIFDNQYGLCLPKLYVNYTREYFLLNDVRISIDTNIMYRNFKTDYQVRDDKIIAELKTSINKNADELAEEFPVPRIRFSKYCFGLEKLYYQ